MTRHLGWLWIGALLFASAAHAVVMDGYAYLWSNSNFCGTKVMFLARSPSAVTDSAFTDTSGFFRDTLSPGVYDVHYSHEGYADYLLPNQALLFDGLLESVWLLWPLSGSLSGVIGPGGFQVMDTIRVEQGQALEIVPGTRFFFDGPHPFIVSGTLEAWGTPEDSVIFTRRYPTDESRWAGIRFVDNPEVDFCWMEYCVVEWAGGLSAAGIRCAGANPTITRCSVRRCSNAGLFITSASPAVSECEFVANRSTYGGGISSYNSNVILSRCIFENDTASESGGGIDISRGQVTLEDCSLIRNYVSYRGAGVAAREGAILIVRHSLFEENFSYYSYTYGGAVSAYDEVNVHIEECVFRNNSGHMAAAIGLNSSTGTIVRSTIAGSRDFSGNEAVAIYCNNAALTLSSSVIYDTWNGHGVSIYAPRETSITYCDFFANDLGAASEAPLGFGIVALTNANGDSCDTYYNIFLDPQFADTAAGDYHLTEGSPCIDAGDPALELDPDGTVADIGAFYFHQLAVDDERTAVRRYALRQNYPNPFNAQTRIAFDIARAGEARLDVFDVTGRLVQTLARGPLSAGTHELLFNARDLPSGMYFARLSAGDFIATKKMLLVK
ncbi:MAG: right-handed parallel beta-helix repeat-containing protein [bacterium]|nr:right-handed parallel beta-helix repeat-containing protein [bacterium]